MSKQWLEGTYSSLGAGVETLIPKYSAFLDRERKVLLPLLLLFIAFMGYQALSLEMDSSRDAFFYENDPVLMMNEQVDANFFSSESMTVFVRIDKSSTEEDRVKSIHDPQVKEYLATVEKKLEQKVFVDYVISPLENPAFFNPGGDSALLLIYMDMGKTDSLLQDQKEQAEEILKNTKKPTGIKSSVGGMPIIFSEISNALVKDLWLTGALSLLIIMACVRIFYGSNRITLVNIFVILCILISIFGSMRLLDVPLNMGTVLIAALTIGIGVDYCLHMQNGFLSSGKNRKDVLTKTFKVVGPPLSIAFITTLIGFLSLFFAGSKLMETMGIATSLGICYVFLYNMTLTPILFLMFGMGPEKREERRMISRFTEKLENGLLDMGGIIARNTFLFLGAVVLFTVLVISGVTMLKSEIKYSDFLPADNPVVKDLNEQTDAFPASFNIMHVVVEADDVLDPDFLKKIDDFEKRLRTVEFVDSVSSPVDRIKAANNGQLPDTRSRIDDPEISQDLKMIRLSIGYGGQAVHDFSTLNDIFVPAIRNEFPTGYNSSLVGDVAQQLRMWEIIGQGSSAVTFFALIFVFVILIFYFRSISIGILALLPVGLAVAATLGLNGWSGVPFSQVTSSVFGMIIGLGIDFSIHTGTRMKQYLSKGSSHLQALEGTFGHLGKLLFLTSLTTVLGFMSLNFAQLSFLQDMGITLAYGILFAFFFAILVLPAIMVALDRVFGKQTKH